MRTGASNDPAARSSSIFLPACQQHSANHGRREQLVQRVEPPPSNDLSPRYLSPCSRVVAGRARSRSTIAPTISRDIFRRPPRSHDRSWGRARRFSSCSPLIPLHCDRSPVGRRGWERGGSAARRQDPPSLYPEDVHCRSTTIAFLFFRFWFFFFLVMRDSWVFVRRWLVGWLVRRCGIERGRREDARNDGGPRGWWSKVHTSTGYDRQTPKTRTHTWTSIKILVYLQGEFFFLLFFFCFSIGRRRMIFNCFFF